MPIWIQPPKTRLISHSHRLEQFRQALYKFDGSCAWILGTWRDRGESVGNSNEEERYNVRRLGMRQEVSEAKHDWEGQRKALAHLG